MNAIKALCATMDFVRGVEQASGIYSTVINEYVVENARLEAENAKLRALVNDMWICISHGSEGWDCTGCRRDPDSVCIMGICEFSQRMCNLGIEVE